MWRDQLVSSSVFTHVRTEHLKSTHKSNYQILFFCERKLPDSNGKERINSQRGWIGATRFERKSEKKSPMWGCCYQIRTEKQEKTTCEVGASHEQPCFRSSKVVSHHSWLEEDRSKGGEAWRLRISIPCLPSHHRSPDATRVAGGSRMRTGVKAGVAGGGSRGEIGRTKTRNGLVQCVIFLYGVVWCSVLY